MRVDNLKYLPIALAIGVFVFFMFRAVNRPDLLPEHSGCFQSKMGDIGYSVRVGSDGKFVSGNIHATVTISKDKGGLSFLPSSKIVISHVRGGILYVEDGFPLLIRISNSGNSILIPSEDGPKVQLDRIPCQ